MPICAAINCNYKPGKMKIPGRTYHRFPFSKPEILKLWIRNLWRECWTPTKYSILCSAHFDEACFYRNGKNVYLKPDAVPTIFEFPPYLEKVIPERKPPTYPPTTIYLRELPTYSLQESASNSQENNEMDYNYSASSTKLKRLLEEKNEECEKLKKKLKLSKQSVKRLQKKVSSLSEIVKELRYSN